jgi:hypothetical protein
LKTKLIQILFENSIPASKRKQHSSITMINWLMLFKEIIAIYSENHRKPINTVCGQNVELLTVKADGTYNYQQ